MITAAHLPEATAREMFEDPQSVIAGAVFPPGRAVPTDGGYRVSGRWGYGSGITHASWLLGVCVRLVDDAPELTPTGAPQLYVMHFPKSAATVHEPWDVMGMAGTGSNDFSIDDLFVPSTHAWQLAPGQPINATFAGPAYCFPFFGYFSAPIAAVAHGIARRAIDAVVKHADPPRPSQRNVTLRDQPMFQTRIVEAESHVRSARAWLYKAIDDAWQFALRGEYVPIPERLLLQLAADNATRSTAAAVDLAYTMGGERSLYRSNNLQRMFRDIHALIQHVATGPLQFQFVGDALLGGPTTNPIWAV